MPALKPNKPLPNQVNTANAENATTVSTMPRPVSKKPNNRPCCSLLPNRLTDLSKTGQGNDSNLLIVFYVQIMPDDFVMQLHRF